MDPARSGQCSYSQQRPVGLAGARCQAEAVTLGQEMAVPLPATMLFVPRIDGGSHCTVESIVQGDAVRGGTGLATAMCWVSVRAVA